MKKLPKIMAVSGAGLAAVAGLSAAGVGVTSAEFGSATTANPDFSITNGTVSLNGSLGTPVAAALDLNKAPGDITGQTFNLKYSGTLNAWVGVDTLILSTINTAGADGTSAVAAFGNVPSDFLYSVLDNPTGGKYTATAISTKSPAAWNAATQVTCPATFDGVTVPATLPVTNADGSVSQATTYCYMASREVAPYKTASGVLTSTETLSNSTTETETGAFPGQTGGSSVTLPITVSMALCNNPDPKYAITGPSSAVVAPNVANSSDGTGITGCDNRVVDAYQGQAFRVILGAVAVAARNNVNGTNNGPQGWVSGWAPAADNPLTGTGNWG